MSAPLSRSSGASLRRLVDTPFDKAHAGASRQSNRLRGSEHHEGAARREHQADHNDDHQAPHRWIVKAWPLDEVREVYDEVRNDKRSHNACLEDQRRVRESDGGRAGDLPGGVRSMRAFEAESRS